MLAVRPREAQRNADIAPYSSILLHSLYDLRRQHDFVLQLPFWCCEQNQVRQQRILDVDERNSRKERTAKSRIMKRGTLN